MRQRLIAATVGALVTIGASSADAQLVGPGVGSPISPTGKSTNSRVATRGANFLEIGQGARAMGMAGGYTALAEGLSSLYWNLAGAADVTNVAGGVNYAQLYGKDGLKFFWGGAVLPIGSGVVGIQFGNMTSGSIDRTTRDFPEGGDTRVGNTFDYTATMAELSYARRLTDRLSVGLGAKYAQEGLTDASAKYLGADVGLKFRTGLYGTTIGAALQNMGGSGSFKGNAVESTSFDQARNPGQVTRIFFRTEQYEMPATFRFSVMSDVMGGPEALLSKGTTAGTLRLVGEFDQAIDTDLQGTIGAEYSMRDIVFLRAGKRWLNESNDQSLLSDSDRMNRGMAFGGGVRLPLGGRRVQFDYAWNGAGELPSTHFFTFEFGF